MKTNITYSLLAVFALAWLAFPSTTRAVSPPPDGDYPGQNTAEGGNALFGLTTGGMNTAIGDAALIENTSGSLNTAVGANALGSNTTADENTAAGADALESNTTGTQNTAIGSQALVNNTTGNQNTATGSQALSGGGSLGVSRMTGSNNTANGFEALFRNTTGANNTAIGAFALQSSATAGFNTATGVDALFSNTTGSNNTANGGSALQSNTTASNNIADGTFALFENTTGPKNTAVGVAALENNTKGGSNVAVGYLAGQNLTIGTNNIDIGANVTGVAGEANTIRIGKQGTQKSTLIAGIFGTAVTGSTVVVNSTGKLGVATSSARFKEGIKPMDKASEAILALKPVSFRYKEEVDPDKTPQFGLVAEEVEKVDPKLVIHDEQGKPFTVRYEAVNAMLLNEFLKEYRAIQDLKEIVSQQQKEIEALAATIREASSK
jgi:hypothetical protein